MNITDLLNPDWWIKRTFRGFMTILILLLLTALAANTPLGPILFLGAVCYVAYRMWASPPTKRPPPQRSTRGAERTPVLPGGEFHP